MKKGLLALVCVLLLGGGGYIFLGQSTVSVAQQRSEPIAAPVAADDSLIVEGRVVPVRSVELQFIQLTAADRVAEVLVKEGDAVRKGAPLARLDTARLELGVEKAKVTLQQAKADYDKLELGATPEEIAAATAEVEQAKAQLQQTQGGVTGSDVAAAQAELTSARAELARLEAGPKTSEVHAAQAALNEARVKLTQAEAGPPRADVQAAQRALDEANAKLAQAEAGPPRADVQAAQAGLDQARAAYASQASSLSLAKTNANAAIEQAANDLRDRQAEYERIYWENQQLAGQVAAEDFPRERRDQEAAAQRAVQNAEQTLQQARVAYDQALQAEQAGNDAAQAQVAAAQANLDKLHADPAQIAAAQAQVAAAQANLDKLHADPAAVASARAQVAAAQANLDKLLRVEPSALAAARARVAQAQASLQRLQGDERAGSVAAAAAQVERTEAGLAEVQALAAAPDLAGALARVEAANVALKEANLLLDQATLRAPMAGTVAEVTITPGSTPAQETAALVIADFSAWQIETTDLTEINIVNVTEGAPVALTFDALPDVKLAGLVDRIKPLGANKQGDIIYTVIITPDAVEPRLRWNMTASAVIQSQ